MSYSSHSTLPRSARASDVFTFIELLGFKRVIRPRFHATDEIAQFYWYDEKDYHSYTGVELQVSQTKVGTITVNTQTPVARSYYDLEQQNRAISGLRKHFGGNFVTDEGTGRYQQHCGEPPHPAEAGCYLAFEGFGHNLIRADYYLMIRSFPNKQWEQTGIFDFLDQLNPRLLSNNLLISYLVSALEDFYKSTFVALFRYSDRKEAVIKATRVTAEQLLAVSNAETTIDEAIAGSMSFQNISTVCRHFRTLDPQIDLAAVLRKPYHGRKQTLFDTLQVVIDARHSFIHRCFTDTRLSDSTIHRYLDDIEASVTRCYKAIVQRYDWPYARGWYRGKKRPNKQMDLMVDPRGGSAEGHF